MSNNGESFTQDEFTVFDLASIPNPHFFRLVAEMNGGLLYLASPYSSEGRVTATIRRNRLAETIAFTEKLLDGGVWVFSPIAYGSSFEDRGYNHDSEWWMRRDFEFFKRCDALGVFCLEGWEKSPGVNKEIEWALTMNKRVIMLNG